MARLLLFLVAVAALAVISASLYAGGQHRAFACTCSLDPPLDRLEKSDAVFAGTVTELAYLGQQGYVAIDVDRAWKGMAEKSTTFRDSTAGGCAVGFKPGERYIVYASKGTGIFGEPGLETYLCQGSRNLCWESVFDDLAILGTGYVPSGDPSPLSRTALFIVSQLGYVVLLALAGSAGAAGIVLLHRRHKGKRQDAT